MKEILQNNLMSQDRSVPPSPETPPFLDSPATVVNSADSPRGRTILTSLLANCAPGTGSKTRPSAASPKQVKEQQQLLKSGIESKKKKSGVKYKKDEMDSIGLNLYQIDTEPLGFVCFDDIVAPDDEMVRLACEIKSVGIYRCLPCNYC